MAESKNALVRFWETIEKAGDSAKAKKRARSLQRQAELDVANAQSNLEESQNTFEKAKVDAKDDTEKGFKNIYEAYMDVKVKQQRFDDAITVYKELFEEEPKML